MALKLKFRLSALLVLALMVQLFLCSGTSRESLIHSIVHKKAKQGWSLKERRDFSNTVARIGQKYALDPLLLLAMIQVESSFNPEARSGKGAIGLLQVQTPTLREVEKTLPAEGKALTDPEYNVKVGAHYLTQLLERFEGNLWKALLAYNQGPTSVSRLYRQRAVPASGYPAKVLKLYLKFRNDSKQA